MANVPIFAVGTHSKILSLVESGVLTYPSYVFCHDTNTIAFLDSELNVHDAIGWNQSSIQVVDELPTAEEARSDTFYISNGKGYLFINGLAVPIFRDITQDTNYDSLENIPIVNKYGDATNPIVVADLSDGSYSISGTYVIGGNLTTKYVTSRKILFIIDSDETGKMITKVNGNNILLYTLNPDTQEVSSTKYATQDWVEKQGFATEAYVQQVYEKLANQVLVTKVSQLENDAGYLTANDIKGIGDDDITNLFYG